MRNAARAVALIAGVLLTALLLAAAIVRLPAIQRWAAAQVSARLPHGVSIERAGLTLLPPGVQLTNVSLADGGPTVASVSCHLRIAPLLRGRAEVASVLVDGASLNVERTPGGDFRLAGPLAGLLGAPAAPGEAAPAPKAAAGIALAQVPAVTIENGQVTFVDHGGRGAAQTLRAEAIRLTLGPAAGGGVEFALTGRMQPAGQVSARGSVRDVAAPTGAVADRALDLTLTADQLDASTVVSYFAAIVPGGGTARAQGGLDGSVTLSGRLAGGLSGAVTLSQPTGSMLWDEVNFAAPLTLSARVAAAADGVAFSDGKLEIANLAAARIVASDLTAAFEVARGTLTLTSARATAYGGTWSQSGVVTLAEPPRFDVRLRADGVRCLDLLTAVTGERPEFGCELFNAEATLRGTWSGAESVARQAEGRGRVDMRGGTIPSSSIIGALWQAIVPHIGARAEPVRLAAPTRFDQLTESFALRSGRMTTNDLRLVTDDYIVSGSGSIGLDGRLDLDTEVALTPAGVAKLLLMASVPMPNQVPDLPAIPTHITGTLGSPTILPAVGKIPFAAIRGLFRGVTKTGELVSDTAGKHLRGLVDGLEQAGKRLIDR